MPILAPDVVPALKAEETTADSKNSSRLQTRASANSQFRDELIAALDIPLTLVERRTGALDIRDAWAKYQGCNTA